MKSQHLKWIFAILTLLTLGQVLWWAYLLNYHHALLTQLSPTLSGLQSYQSFKRMIIFESLFFILIWLFCMYLAFKAYKKELLLQRAHSTFLGAISHELKTPLAIIRLSLDTLARRSLDENKRTVYLDRANIATNKLTKEVENILHLTANNTVKTAIQKLSLNRIVSDCVDQVKDIKPLQQFEMSVKLMEDFPIRGSDLESRLVLKNIIENAIKYGSGRIEIYAENLGRKTSLVVRDNGIGMTKDEIKNAFQPFWRSDRVINDAKPGTGMGLTLARELSQKAGIQILLDSDGEGKGTTTRIVWETAQL